MSISSRHATQDQERREDLKQTCGDHDRPRAREFAQGSRSRAHADAHDAADRAHQCKDAATFMLGRCLLQKGVHPRLDRGSGRTYQDQEEEPGNVGVDDTLRGDAGTVGHQTGNE